MAHMSTFLDYKIPSILDLPLIEPVIVEEADKEGPFGARGIGEPPILAMAPAIANAIEDAVGVRITSLPITAEKVLRRCGRREPRITQMNAGRIKMTREVQPMARPVLI